MEDPFEEFRGLHPTYSVIFSPPVGDSTDCTIFLAGDLDSEVSQDFLYGAIRALTTMYMGSVLVVDLTNVGYISSTGVGALAQTLSEAAQRRVTLRLKGLAPECSMIFKTLGLLKYFEIEKGRTKCPN